MSSNNMRRGRKANTYSGLSVVPVPKPSLTATTSLRLTFAELKNDDGHVVGLESHWIPLGTAVNSVLARLAGERR
jgi:hypothetical protein